MHVLNFISKNIFLPISDLITGQSIYKNLLFLEKSQYWTREQLDAYQNKKLRELIHHAYTNVPFYRELFLDLRIKPEDIQTKKDLVKLPIITKDDFRKNKSKWIANNITRKDLIFLSSSGSTGEPFQYYSTKYSTSFQKATAIRGWNWMGYRLGDKYVKTSIRARTSFIKLLQDKINNSLFITFTNFNPEYFQKINKKILKFDPIIIRGYPVPLMFLSNQMEVNQRKYQGKNLIAINTTGSTLHEKERLHIEKYFNVRVYDSYSCEAGAIYFQCPTHENYHPAEEYAISEFITDNFTLTDPEHPKRHITTDLQNYACPFIRYDTQDYIILGDNKPCSCGREYLNIKKIRGRDTDVLVTPSGKYILMENILGYFEDNDKISHYILQIQVVQEQINRIIFNMVVKESYSNEIQNEIYNYWQNFIGKDVNIIINILDEIKLTTTGKRRTIIRNPLIKLDDGL